MVGGEQLQTKIELLTDLLGRIPELALGGIIDRVVKPLTQPVQRIHEFFGGLRSLRIAIAGAVFLRVVGTNFL